MATITVRFFAAAREAFGTRARDVRVETLGDLRALLSAEADPPAVTVLERSSFLVNTVAATDEDRRFDDGDTVDVLPPFAGG